MSKTLSKYVTVFDYADKKLHVLLGSSTDVFLFSFT